MDGRQRDGFNFFYSWHLCKKSEQIVKSGQEYFLEIWMAIHKARIKMDGRYRFGRFVENLYRVAKVDFLFWCRPWFLILP
jgi:hypothetical protein